MRPPSATCRIAVGIAAFMLIVVALAVLLNLQLALAASKSFESETALTPVIIKVVNKPVVYVEAFNDSILYIVSSGNGYEAVYAEFDSESPLPKLEPLAKIHLASRPMAVTSDSLLKPNYIFVATEDGSLIIWDLNKNETTIFGFPSPITSLAYVDAGRPSVLFVTADGRAYIVSQGEAGWFEAGDIVGNLLPRRWEGVRVTSVAPVLKAGRQADYSGQVILRVESLPYYTPVAKLRIQVVSNSTPVAGAIVYGYHEGEFTLEEMTDENGSALLPLPWLPQNLNIIVSFNGSCWLFNVSLSDSIRSGDILEYPKPLDIKKGVRSPCVKPKYETRFYLVGGGTLEFKVLNESSMFASKSNLMLAYKLNNTLYLWLSLPRETGWSITLLKYDVRSLELLDTRFYYTSNRNPVQAVMSPDAKVVIVAASEGSTYILMLENGSYKLVWSYKLLSMPATMLMDNFEGEYIATITLPQPALSVVRISPHHNVPILESWSPECQTCVELPFETSLAAIVRQVHDLVLGGRDGLYIAKNYMYLVLKHPITPEELKRYLASNITIRVVNEDGKPVSGLEAVVKLVYKNTTFYEQRTLIKDGVLKTLCIPIANVSLTIIAGNMSAIYLPVSKVLSCAKEGGLEVVVPYRRYNITLKLVDGYTGRPPATNLTVIVRDLERNITMSYTVLSGTESSTITGLIPSNYSVTIKDSTGLYYEKKLIVMVPYNESILVTLRRIPVPVTVVLHAEELPQIPESVLVKLEAEKVGVIYSREINLTSPQLTLRFLTPYRGEAILEVKSLPPSGQGPFYKPILRPVIVGGNGVSISVKLKPAIYRVKLVIEAISPHGDVIGPIEARIVILQGNNTIVDETANGSLTVLLHKGYYIVKGVPPSFNSTNLTLYKPVTKKVLIATNNTIVKLDFALIRIPTRVTIVDRIVSGGNIADELSVIVDGVEVSRIKPGRPVTLVLPLKLNGSKLVVLSKNGIYVKLEKKVKPSNKTIVIALVRKAVPLKILVTDEKGEPISSAKIEVRGIDVVFSTSLVSGPDGTITAMLPVKANYQVCAMASGYHKRCSMLLLSKPGMEVKLALTPTLRTLILEKYFNIIIAVVVAAVVIGLAKYYLSRLAEKLAAEEEF